MLLPIAINVLLVIHVLTSLLIILLVLMQRPKNEGLGAAFGGGMTENLFGAQTTNVLQTITRWLGGIFFALTLLLSYLYVKHTAGRSSPVQQQLSAPTKVPAAPATSLPAGTPGSPTAPAAAASDTVPAPVPGEANRAGDAAPGAAPVPATPPLEKPADRPPGATSAEKPATSPSDTPAGGKPASPEAPTGGQKPTGAPTSVPPQTGPTVPPAAPSGSSQ